MDKPLPDLPMRPRISAQVTNPATLAVDTRDHLHAFILRAVEDEGDALGRAEGAAEEWVSAIENALGAFGERLAMGGWLPGLRRARMRRAEDRELKRSKERITMKKTEAADGAAAGKKDDVKAKGPDGQDAETKDFEGYLSIGRVRPRTEQFEREALRSLWDAVTNPPVAAPKLTTKHLLLTLAPAGTFPTQWQEETAYRLSPPSAECAFVAGIFSLPYESSEDSRGTVVYGLDSWEPSMSDHSVQVVGGTFYLKGFKLDEGYAALAKVLKLSLFVYLSNILEQCLFVDSNVPLRFPKPSLSATAVSNGQAGASMTRALSSSQVGRKAKRDDNSLTGWWSYLSRKKDSLIHRATHAGSAGRSSLELPLTRSLTPSPKTSFDSTGNSPSHTPRSRRFSIISDYRPSFMLPQSPSREADARPFAAALARIEKYRNVLSTSPSIIYPPPRLLRMLADLEKADPERKLSGDEKAAVMSLLGWEGKNACGAGMADMTGFVRQQSFSVLYSEYVLPHSTSDQQTPSRPSTPGLGLAASASVAALAMTTMPTYPPQPEAPQRILCGKRRRWLTLRFFAHDSAIDDCLGDVLYKLCTRADEPCDQPNCRTKRGEHELRFIHGSTRVTMTVQQSRPSSAEEKEANRELPEMWEWCAVCKKETTRQVIQDGTYLYSFAKYLELLVYSPTMCTISPPLCSHTSAPQKPWTALDTPLPQNRMNIIRSFAFKGRTVSVTLSPVEDVYEVKVPRIQILRLKCGDRSNEVELRTPGADQQQDEAQEQDGEADRRALRKEIKTFWQGLSERIDQLEQNFDGEHSVFHKKSLPRLPSADDAYEDLDENEHENDEETEPSEAMTTPKLSSRTTVPLDMGVPLGTTPTPTPTSATPKGVPNGESAYPFPPRSPSPPATPTPPDSHQSTVPSTLSTASFVSSSSSEQDSLALLTSLRHTFQRTERSLYVELARTELASLNDVRRVFFSSAKGATKRLRAWEVKHAGAGATGTGGGTGGSGEPEWWKSGCHAVPGSNVIVREDDWGSVIAFTLSSPDYQRELASMSYLKPPGSTIVPYPPPPSPTPTRPSFFNKTASASAKWFAGANPGLPEPDPDEEGGVWHEPETYSAVISRKENPRDPTSLLKLGLPDVLKAKALAAGPDGASTLPFVSKFATIGPSGGGNMAPRAAFAKAEVQISKEEADGLLSAANIERVDKVLQELEGSSARTARTSSGDTAPTTSSFIETNVRRGKASSLLSMDSESTISATAPPTPPPKDLLAAQEKEKRRERGYGASRESSLERRDDNGLKELPSTPMAASASGFIPALSSAFRYMLGSGDVTPISGPGARAHHHGLLSANMTTLIDDKPHVKHEWTIGKRVKFACTVYYAKQFDALRKRCGIEDSFVRSLARCENWAAEGGKSRSNFWRTTDNRFIIKTLVNAWNVADLHVLIELGPSYFRYMDATISKPTLIAKMLGFYTVEIKNLETGAVQAKADLLVMENLFYKRDIVKTFDLKGIQGRKVKPSSSSSGSKTLFDGEWIEGQQRTLTLVTPYSKVVLQEAIKADSDFLMRSNIMDYSLLVGIDESKKQLACGLVDTIGSYTFAKTLEHKAKQGLNAGKEVTVVPPQDYQERFMNAMDNYFVACPDKWSRPLDDTKIPGDYKQLPSVL